MVLKQSAWLLIGERSADVLHTRGHQRKYGIDRLAQTSGRGAGLFVPSNCHLALDDCESKQSFEHTVVSGHNEKHPTFRPGELVTWLLLP